MVFWDSPESADEDARRPRARCDGEDINRRATATTRARAWLRDALERGTTATARATATKETLVLDDAAREAREGATSEEESRHLRRHVDALTRECADAVARANASEIARERFEQLRRENAALKNADALCKKAETRAKAAEARANAARDAMVRVGVVAHEERDVAPDGGGQRGEDGLLVEAARRLPQPARVELRDARTHRGRELRHTAGRGGRAR